MVVLRNNDWLNDQWPLEQFHIRFVSWLNMRATIPWIDMRLELIHWSPKTLLTRKSNQCAVRAAVDLPLSGYTIGVYIGLLMQPQLAGKIIWWDLELISCISTRRTITRNDFLTWLDMEVRRVYATRSTLFILDNPHRSLPNDNFTVRWLREKEEEEWFGNERDEHLRICLVKCNTISGGGSGRLARWSHRAKKDRMNMLMSQSQSHLFVLRRIELFGGI